jgi:hypothetical protein
MLSTSGMSKLLEERLLGISLGSKVSEAELEIPAAQEFHRFVGIDGKDRHLNSVSDDDPNSLISKFGSVAKAGTNCDM